MFWSFPQYRWAFHNFLQTPLIWEIMSPGLLFLFLSSADCSDHSSFTEAWHYSLLANHSPPHSYHAWLLFPAFQTSFSFLIHFFNTSQSQWLMHSSYFFFFIFLFYIKSTNVVAEGNQALTFIAACYITVLNMPLYKPSVTQENNQKNSQGRCESLENENKDEWMYIFLMTVVFTFHHPLYWRVPLIWSLMYCLYCENDPVHLINCMKHWRDENMRWSITSSLSGTTI